MSGQTSPLFSYSVHKKITNLSSQQDIFFEIGPACVLGPLVAPSIMINRCRNGSSLKCSKQMNQCNGFFKCSSNVLSIPSCRPVFVGSPSQLTANKSWMLIFFFFKKSYYSFSFVCCFTVMRDAFMAQVNRVWFLQDGYMILVDYTWVISIIFLFCFS